MREIEINKDLSQIESKVAPLNVTFRQLVCLGIGGVISLLVYTLCSRVEFLYEFRIPGIVILGAPFALAGWYKPYGMAFEVFIKDVYIPYMFKPSKRIYATKNTIEEEYHDFLVSPLNKNIERNDTDANTKAIRQRDKKSKEKER